MRNLELLDAVFALHEIAHLVEIEIGESELSKDIRMCADRLHKLSLIDSKNSIIAQDIIKKAKE